MTYPSRFVRLACLNLFHDDRGIRLTVAARPPVLLATLLLEDQDLLRLVVGQHPPDDFRPLQDGAPDLEPAIRLQGEDPVERHFVTDTGLDLLDLDAIADGDLVLLASGAYDGVAHAFSSFPW